MTVPQQLFVPPPQGGDSGVSTNPIFTSNFGDVSLDKGINPVVLGGVIIFSIMVWRLWKR